MNIETVEIRIGFNGSDAGRMCAILKYVLDHEYMDEKGSNFALRLKEQIEGAFNW